MVFLFLISKSSIREFPSITFFAKFWACNWDSDNCLFRYNTVLSKSWILVSKNPIFCFNKAISDSYSLLFIERSILNLFSNSFCNWSLAFCVDSSSLLSAASLYANNSANSFSFEIIAASLEEQSDSTFCSFSAISLSCCICFCLYWSASCCLDIFCW